MEEQHQEQKIEKSKGYWGIIWKRLRKNRRAIAGLYFVLLMFVITIFSPLLANDKPIICKLNGEIYMPGIIQIFQARGLGDHWLKIGGEFDKPSFDAKAALADDEGSWDIWPLIPFGEYEVDEKCGSWPAPPSSKHWLGTDLCRAGPGIADDSWYECSSAGRFYLDGYSSCGRDIHWRSGRLFWRLG